MTTQGGGGDEHKWKIVVGSLVGATAIHGVLAACGRGSSGSFLSQDGGGGVIDALMEALQGSDAQASTDAGSPLRTHAPNGWQVAPERVTAAGGDLFAVTFNPNLNEYVVWIRSCQ
jgi:hypothetical protein